MFGTMPSSVEISRPARSGCRFVGDLTTIGVTS